MYIIRDMSNTATSPIQTIRNLVTNQPTDALIVMLQEIDGNNDTNARVVSAAITEVLIDRFPAIISALDEWEMDLTFSRTMTEVVIDTINATN